MLARDLAIVRKIDSDHVQGARLTRLRRDVPTSAADRAARILAVVAQIPRGTVLSYGEVARRAGLAGRARLVGRVLAQTGVAVPWHRVLRADGMLAFAAGSVEFDEQSRRLWGEGVTMRKGRVVRSRLVRGEPSLDAALWGLEPDRDALLSRPRRSR